MHNARCTMQDARWKMMNDERFKSGGKAKRARRWSVSTRYSCTQYTQYTFSITYYIHVYMCTHVLMNIFVFLLFTIYKYRYHNTAVYN